MTNTVPISARRRPLLHRQRSPGLAVTSIEAPAHREFHFTVRPLPGETPAALVRRFASALKQADATVVRHEVFGPLTAHADLLRALKRELGEIDWPVTWVDGGACEVRPVMGMHILAVADAEVETVCFAGRPIGRVFSDGWAKHCLLGDVRPQEVSSPKTAQAKAAFETLEQALGAAGMDMSNVVRTWLFLDDILSWYGPFNAVRTEFFQQRGVFHGLVPASTGVGGRNPAGAAVLAGAWAVQTADNSAPARQVPSPLQCPAPEYGSSFSRAVQLTTPGFHRLLVSGTASIKPNGRSAHRGNLDRQIELTMDVVRAILTSRGLDFSDTTRATGYFKRLTDAPAFDAWLAKRGLESLPWVPAQTDICRDELLFELELDAMAPATKD